MTIESKIEGVKRLLERVRDYKGLIEADSFESGTIVDMKGNAKDLCDAAKIEIDSIKDEIDSWE